MSGKNGKARCRLSAAAKFQILEEEAQAPQTTVAEVLRRPQLDATIFYRWEPKANAAMLAALGEKPRGSPDPQVRDIEA